MSIIYGNTKPQYMQIIPNWANITGPLLKAGTPISAAGIVANSDAAIGILPNDVGKTDPVRPVSLIVRGILSLPDIEESFGASLTDACKAALDEIAFVKSDGTLDVASSLPDYSEASEGDVLSIDSNGDPAWAPPSGGALVITANYSGASTGATPAEISAAAAAGTPMYIKWGNTMRPAILATADGGSNYLESHFVTMDTDMQTGNWTVFATRWRIQLLTSSLSQVYSSSEQLALYSDIGGGMVEGVEG